MKFLGFLIVLAALAFGGLYAGSPWLAFHQIADAARAGDQDRLEGLVDYPALHRGMRRQVDSKPTRLSRTMAGIGFLPVQAVGKLGAMHGDRKIRRLVAAGALARLVEGQASYAYLTLDRVRVAVAQPSGEAAGFVMERRGLFGWKLVKLELPGEKIRPAD
jgi:hypothetical protein